MTRLLTTTLTMRGTTFDAVYSLSGTYMPATATDRAERPTVEGLRIEVNGEDITGLVCEGLLEDIAIRIEEELE